jgi:soluble lytic murein transglycosylase-like protein
MQLADSTAEQMGVSDSLDPHENIVGGTKYLRELLNRYDGDLRLTLAAYNAGPGAVSKFNGIPPFSETQDYIEKVLERLNSGSQ